MRHEVGRRRLTASKPELKPRLVSANGNQCLKPKCNEPLSNFAFDFDLRRHKEEELGRLRSAICLIGSVVGRCRLTL